MVSAPPCSSSYITFSPLKLRPAQTYRFKKKLLRQAFDNNLYLGNSLRGEGEEETCFVLTMILSGRLKQKTITESGRKGRVGCGGGWVMASKNPSRQRQNTFCCSRQNCKKKKPFRILHILFALASINSHS